MAKTPVGKTQTAQQPQSDVVSGEVLPAVVDQQSQDLDTIPEWMARDGKGTEDIEREDIQMPRLAIAQGLSPEVNEEKPQYIDGLKLGHMFNTLTQAMYGRGPMEFIIIRRYPPRWVEFAPRDEGGGVVDLNVPPDDPRTQFRKDPETHESLPPVATKFYDYVIMLLPSREVIALSMKGKMLKQARALNAMVKLKTVRIYGAKYSLQSISESNAKGTYYVFQFKATGLVRDQQLYLQCEQAHEALEQKTINIQREPGDDDMEFPDVPGPAGQPGQRPTPDM